MDFDTYTPTPDPIWSMSVLFPPIQEIPRKAPKKKEQLNRVRPETCYRIDTIGRPIVLPKMTSNIERVLSKLREQDRPLRVREIVELLPDLDKSGVCSALKSLELRGEVVKSGLPRRGKNMTTGFMFEAVIKTCSK